MNIYSALRSPKRKQLVQHVRKYIQDDGFVSILESIDVENPNSIRQGCRALNACPCMRSKVMAWLKS